MNSNFEQLKKKADLIRKWCLLSTTEAASGHPTSCLSAADIGATLFDKYFTYDIQNPKNKYNDRFILSKGHASPLFYTLFAMSGGIPMEELLTLRKFGSRLEGHPTLEFPFTDVATGSLGQGLSVGAGMALVSQRDSLGFKTYVLLGDSELAEGSNFEAANFASYYKLNNLIAIADINRLGQSQETMFGHQINEYIERFSAFGWEVLAIDGHNFEEIDRALRLAAENKSDKPFVIIAKTKKGKGISFLEDKEGWHGKPLKKEDLQKALEELGDVDDNLRFDLKKPQKNEILEVEQVEKRAKSAVSYNIGEEVATREVYGKVLAELGKENDDIVALDAEVKNSTYSQDFQKAFPNRFVECFIAEQNMVGVGLGMSKIGKIPFSSTFAAFFTRAFDQIRMARLSGGNLKFVGSHAGVSIGEDGASQMGLEDFAQFGVLPDSVVLHPADGVSTTKLLPLMLNHQGIAYLRTLRPKTPTIYTSNEQFEIGGSKVLRLAQDDILTIVACGITVFEALKAYEELAKEHISVRVIDCYSIKPVDKKTLEKALKETKKNCIITVEDHFEHGGLGDFVLAALSDTGARIEKMAVDKVARSGKSDELLDYVGISSKHIIEKVKSLL